MKGLCLSPRISGTSCISINLDHIITLDVYVRCAVDTVSFPSQTFLISIIMGKWVDADDVNEKELMRKMKNLFDEALAKECNDVNSDFVNLFLSIFF